MLLIKAITQTLSKISRQAEDRFCKVYAEFELNEINRGDYVDPSDSLNKFFEAELGKDEFDKIQDYLDQTTNPKSLTWHWEYIARQYAEILFPNESNIRKLFLIVDGYDCKPKHEFMAQYKKALNQTLNKIGQPEIDDNDDFLNLNFEGDSSEQFLDIITNTSGVVVINCQPPRPSSTPFGVDTHPLLSTRSVVELFQDLMVYRPASIRAKAIIFSGDQQKLSQRLTFMANTVLRTSQGPVENLREMSHEQWMKNMMEYGEEPAHRRDYLMSWTKGAKHEPK